jgi:hypothetical protein
VRYSHDRWNRLWLALALLGLLGLLLAPRALTSAKQTAKTDLAQAARDLEKLYANVEAKDRALPAEKFDPATVVKKVGTDPRRLFEWVRDNTYWVPYQGSLRGPVGVLVDRVGSSLDRALLLAELLRIAGHNVQIARAALSDEEAAKLYASLTPVPADIFARDSSDGDEAARKRCGQVLSDLEASLGPPPASAETELSADLRDHWWVQMEDDEGWKNLDPSAPASKFGTALREEPDETFYVDPETGLSDLPPDSVHQVIVRVKIEKWESGKLSEHDVLEAAVRPIALLAKPIVLVHVPLDLPEDAAPIQNEIELKAMELKIKEWLPVLIVGENYLAERSFKDTGEIVENPNLEEGGGNPADMAQDVGGLLGGEEPEETEKEAKAKATKPSKSLLTAEWIDYEIHSPGRPVQKIRRESFDLIGPAAREAAKVPRPVIGEEKRSERALRLAGELESLIQPFRWTQPFLLHIYYQSVLSQRELWLNILREKDAEERKRLMESVTAPTILHALAAARHALSPVRSRVFFDTPNVLSYRFSLRSDAQGKLVEQDLFDIVSNDVAVLSGGGPSTSAVRLRQGLADTAAEDLILEGEGSGFQNTLRLFAAAGPRLQAFRDVKDAAFATLSLPPDIKARVASDLRNGYTVVLPESPPLMGTVPDFGWWRIDPRTGGTVGVMGTGYHAQITERAYLENDTVISKTAISHPGYLGRGRVFWKKHPIEIAKKLGLDPFSIEDLGFIIDHQWALLRAGLL